METEITLRIILLKPTGGVDFGLQKGSGNNYETVQTQRSTGLDLNFQFNVRLKLTDKSEPNFLGPFVQGPTTGRFIYVDIGTYAGQTNTPWSRRLKVPLTGISFDTLKRLSADPNLILETKVPGTGKDGSPSCATVKPFEGWKLTKESFDEHSQI